MIWKIYDQSTFSALVAHLKKIDFYFSLLKSNLLPEDDVIVKNELQRLVLKFTRRF